MQDAAPGLIARLQQALAALAVATALPVAAQSTTATDEAACPPAAEAPSPAELLQGMLAARDRGFLWRIVKNGQTSYLYGTLHIGKPEWAFPGPNVRAALNSSDTLALEIDPTDPAMARSMAAPPSPPSLPELNDELRERLARHAEAMCLPKQALAALHPLMQAMTYMVMSARWDGLDPSWAQEPMLAGFARGAGRSVVSLESVQLQLSALIPDDPHKALKMVDDTLDQLEQGRARPMLARIAQAWESGDLSELENFERWCECTATESDRAALRTLNDARNPRMAERIDALHRSGRPVFAAVGALHMTGAHALPTLMAQRGYQVERVEFAQ